MHFRSNTVDTNKYLWAAQLAGMLNIAHMVNDWFKFVSHLCLLLLLEWNQENVAFRQSYELQITFTWNWIVSMWFLDTDALTNSLKTNTHTNLHIPLQQRLIAIAITAILTLTYSCSYFCNVAAVLWVCCWDFSNILHLKHLSVKWNFIQNRASLHHTNLQ